MYLMLSGNFPFDGNGPGDVIRKVKLGKFNFENAEWSGVSAEAKDLIKRLLVVNPDERYSCV